MSWPHGEATPTKLSAAPRPDQHLRRHRLGFVHQYARRYGLHRTASGVRLRDDFVGAQTRSVIENLTCDD
jgi:hypothetical protein